MTPELEKLKAEFPAVFAMAYQAGHDAALDAQALSPDEWTSRGSLIIYSNGSIVGVAASANEAENVAIQHNAELKAKK